MIRCMDCGEEIVSFRGCGFAITGIELERAEGGTNHVWRRERTGKVMCADCALKMKHHIPNANQMTLA